MNHITILDDKNCCGCGACACACPIGAIEMVQNAEGFLYPRVDEVKCIDCGKCVRVCAFKGRTELPKTLRLFAARVKDNEVLRASSSGGAFSLLAEAVLKRGGVVFGVGWVSELQKARHIKITRLDELAKIRGSKYVQSEIGDAFLAAKECLEEGHLVLFSGTPCQLTGLRSFLGKKYDNLICVDVVCHGVPSPEVLKEYLNETIAQKVEKISFRDKIEGWKCFSLSVESEGEKRILGSIKDNLYLRGFVANLYLRPSCYDCKADKLKSDITLADYWNIGKVVPDLDDDFGMTAVLVSSEKGMELMESCADRMNSQETSLKNFFVINPNVLLSSPKHPHRDRFMREFSNGNHSCVELITKNLAPTWLSERIRKIKRHFNKKRMRQFADKILMGDK